MGRLFEPKIGNEASSAFSQEQHREFCNLWITNLVLYQLSCEHRCLSNQIFNGFLDTIYDDDDSLFESSEIKKLSFTVITDLWPRPWVINQLMAYWVSVRFLSFLVKDRVAQKT